MIERPTIASRRTSVTVVFGVAAVAVLLVTLVRRSEKTVNTVALTDRPQPVGVIRTTAASYRAIRSYVGTLEPWNMASIGPQFVSAYVESVEVRPGAVVKKGDVLATLDCRDVHSSAVAVAARARALDAQQQALANQVKRLGELQQHGFVSADDVEQKTAASLAETEQLAAEKAHMSSVSLEVADCVLRAPFDGEITARQADPGAFVRPGASIVAVTDRHTVRFTADVPENDFRAVAPSTHISLHVDSIGVDLDGAITRRTPSADYATRTVHFEVDLPNADHTIPVNVTAVATIEIGDAITTTQVPIRAASVQNGRAAVFVVEGDIAHARTAPIIGERGDTLFVEASALPSGAQVVTEGRTLLADGDHVTSQPERTAVTK
jgi:membrane fusion protein (multidrug efflux system)